MILERHHLSQVAGMWIAFWRDVDSHVTATVSAFARNVKLASVRPESFDSL